MNIQFYPKELNWVNAQLRMGCGSFLEHFCLACSHADGENYELLRLVVCQMMSKYPVKSKFVCTACNPDVVESFRTFNTREHARIHVSVEHCNAEGLEEDWDSHIREEAG